MFSFFQGVPPQPFVHPASFSGIYSQDDFVNNMAQRVPHDFPFAHARVHPFGRQRGHHHYHHHPHHHNHYPGGPYGRSFSPASWDNLGNDFGPANGGSHPAFFSPNHRGATFSPEELAYNFLQQGGRQRAHERRLQAIARQRELAREREAQYQRARAEAVALEQQVRAAREAHIRAANAARAHARQRRDEEVLLALLAQLGLAAASVQSAVDVSQASRETPSVQLTPSAAPATPAAPASAPSEPRIPTEGKGKGKAVQVPVEATTTSTPAPAPAPAKVPTLQEELEARIRTETDPDVQASLVLLYSDLFDVREPAPPVAGPSGHKHVSFQVPISGPSPSASGSASHVPVQVEEPIDTNTTALSTIATHVAAPVEDHDGANADRPPSAPSLAQIKDVEDTLRKLEGAFEFPAQLDFVDRPRSRSPSPSPEMHSDTESASLAYTSNNTPVHAYEHALNELLTKLDAVESNGDVEVRGRRREVVKEVERALEAMERRIEESRERSRERARRASVNSQVSDASVTVTPYNVYAPYNVDEAVTAEEVSVEVPVEVEEPEAAYVEDVSVVTEDPTFEVEVAEEVTEATNLDSEDTVASPLVDNAEPESKPLALGIPDSGADLTAPYLSHPSIFSDPSSPVDEDEEDLEGAFDAVSPSGHASAPQVVPPTVETLAESSPGFSIEVTEQDASEVGAESQDAESEPELGVPGETEPVSEPHSPLEPAEDSVIIPPPTQSAPEAPEPISPIESTATDATFVTAAADTMFFDADTTTRSKRTPAPTPGSPASTSSAGEEAFLLSSTPLADEHQPKQRRASSSESAGDDADELEIIRKEELEVAKNDSDWSDVESESDLEIV